MDMATAEWAAMSDGQKGQLVLDLFTDEFEPLTLDTTEKVLHIVENDWGSLPNTTPVQLKLVDLLSEVGFIETHVSEDGVLLTRKRKNSGN